jgi:hypothetical protein
LHNPVEDLERALFAEELSKKFIITLMLKDRSPSSSLKPWRNRMAYRMVYLDDERSRQICQHVRGTLLSSIVDYVPESRSSYVAPQSTSISVLERKGCERHNLGNRAKRRCDDLKNNSNGTKRIHGGLSSAA